MCVESNLSGLYKTLYESIEQLLLLLYMYMCKHTLVSIILTLAVITSDDGYTLIYARLPLPRRRWQVLLEKTDLTIVISNYRRNGFPPQSILTLSFAFNVLITIKQFIIL